MLHGKVLRSPHRPRADPRRSTSAAALELDGVAAILTGADLDDIEPYYGHAIKDRPIVAIDRVRFAGEPVAAVAAVDEATAEAAVRAIEVDYEELPVLGTLEQALAPRRAAAARAPAQDRALPRPRRPRRAARATSATAT